MSLVCARTGRLAPSICQADDVTTSGKSCQRDRLWPTIFGAVFTLALMQWGTDRGIAIAAKDAEAARSANGSTTTPAPSTAQPEAKVSRGFVPLVILVVALGFLYLWRLGAGTSGVAAYLVALGTAPFVAIEVKVIIDRRAKGLGLEQWLRAFGSAVAYAGALVTFATVVYG